MHVCARTHHRTLHSGEVHWPGIGVVVMVVCARACEESFPARPSPSERKPPTHPTATQRAPLCPCCHRAVQSSTAAVRSGLTTPSCAPCGSSMTGCGGSTPPSTKRGRRTCRCHDTSCAGAGHDFSRHCTTETLLCRLWKSSMSAVQCCAIRHMQVVALGQRTMLTSTSAVWFSKVPSNRTQLSWHVGTTKILLLTPPCLLLSCLPLPRPQVRQLWGVPP